jgi:hypothetical protein
MSGMSGYCIIDRREQGQAALIPSAQVVSSDHVILVDLNRPTNQATNTSGFVHGSANIRSIVSQGFVRVMAGDDYSLVC